jgi:hypothetical protein
MIFHLKTASAKLLREVKKKNKKNKKKNKKEVL